MQFTFAHFSCILYEATFKRTSLQLSGLERLEELSLGNNYIEVGFSISLFRNNIAPLGNCSHLIPFILKVMNHIS